MARKKLSSYQNTHFYVDHEVSLSPADTVKPFGVITYVFEDGEYIVQVRMHKDLHTTVFKPSELYLIEKDDEEVEDAE